MEGLLSTGPTPSSFHMHTFSKKGIFFSFKCIHPNLISDKGGGGVSRFLIFSDKGGGGVSQFLTLADKGGSGGLDPSTFG